MKKYYLLPFLFLLSLGSCTQEARTSKQQQTPNIIFIMADDMGYADAGCYGQALIKTPNIDRLAKEGLRFTQAYAGAAVCAPSRSVLMTGMHTGHTSVRGNFGIGGVKGLAGIEGRVPIKAADYTLAEMLKEAGYTTGMIGKWGLGEPNTTGEPNAQGFDEFFGFLNQRRAHSYYPDYLWENRKKVQLTGNKDGKGTDYTHDLFANKALDFIKKNQQKSFFLYLPLCIPHNHYELPDVGIYKDKDWPKDAIAYAAMISRMDNSVGRIMQALKDTGIDENTIVFFTSDNGAAKNSQEWQLFNSNAPFKGAKRDPYEGGIRVPMIVRYPNKIAAGTTTDLACYFADIFPTIADMLAVPKPKNMDGRSILPTLMGQVQNFSDRYLYWEFYEQRGWRAVRMGDWKAIQQDMHFQKRQAIELYHLASDISETTNVAAAHPELVKKAADIFEKAHTPSVHYKWKQAAN